MDAKIIQLFFLKWQNGIFNEKYKKRKKYFFVITFKEIRFLFNDFVFENFKKEKIKFQIG